jgi:hypothetical protein
MTKVNRNHHQYSARVARPLKSTYFEKQVRMESAGDIIPAVGVCAALSFISALVSPLLEDISGLTAVPHEVQ